MSNPLNWDQVKEAYGEGASDVEIARLLNLSETEFYEYENEHPEFARFLAKGRTLSKAWWYEKHRTNLGNKEFNTSLYNFAMKNRFGWADKVESNDTTDKDPVNLDQMKAQLNSALTRMGKKDPELIRVLTGASSNG